MDSNNTATVSPFQALHARLTALGFVQRWPACDTSFTSPNDKIFVGFDDPFDNHECDAEDCECVLEPEFACITPKDRSLTLPERTADRFLIEDESDELLAVAAEMGIDPPALVYAPRPSDTHVLVRCEGSIVKIARERLLQWREDWGPDESASLVTFRNEHECEADALSARVGKLHGPTLEFDALPVTAGDFERVAQDVAEARYVHAVKHMHDWYEVGCADEVEQQRVALEEAKRKYEAEFDAAMKELS